MANTIKWIRQNISHFPVNHSVFRASAWMITAADVSVQGNFSTSLVCYWQNGLLLSSKTSKVVPMRAHTICIPSWFELKDSLWRYTGRTIIRYLFSHTLNGDTSHPEEQYALFKNINDGRLKAFCTQQNKNGSDKQIKFNFKAKEKENIQCPSPPTSFTWLYFGREWHF